MSKTDNTKKARNGTGASEEENAKLIPITIRFRKDAYDSLKRIAKQNNLSLAEVVRIVIDNRAIAYLKSVWYVPEELGTEISKEIFDVGTSLQDIRNEINRIGVNYNQEIKLKNIEAKYGNTTDIYKMKRKEKELSEVKTGSTSFTRKEFVGILKKYQSIAKKMAQNLNVLLK